MANKRGDGGDPNKVYVANTTGSAYDKKSDQTFTFRKGETRVRGGHVLLELARDYFEPIEDHIHYDVEQATKAPGEKRGGAAARVAGKIRRSSKPAAKPAPEPVAPLEPTPDPDAVTSSEAAGAEDSSATTGDE